MEDKQASYYMNIPAPVWDSGMNAKAILMYGHITVLANKKGYCYATNSYFQKVLDVSDTTVGRYLNELEKKGFISRQLIYAEDSKQVSERRIYMNTGMFTGVDTPGFKNEHGPGFKNEQDNTTSNNNINNNTKETKWDILYNKLIDGYPKNRIQSKNPVIKLLKQLDKDQIKLVLGNKQRYLKASNGYVKNLRKYIEEECWSEEWLKLQESTNKTSKGGITTNENHNFDIDNDYE